MKAGIQQLIILIIFLWTPSMIFSQSVDEIIEKHIAAHGGAENWNAVDVLKITGKFTAFSLENDYISYKTKSGYYFGEFNLGEMHVIESFDGVKGWTIDPWQEIDYARHVNPTEENAFLQKAEFFSPFYKYKEKGHTVVYTGLDTVDGIQVFALELTRNNGKTETWYLRSDNYLEYLCRSEWVDFARLAPSEVFFDDFRTVDGLVIPFYTERTFWQRNRILQIDEVTINPHIDESMFSMPPRKEMKELEFLIGEWDVAVETWVGAGTWYNLGNTISEIKYAPMNRLQENMTYERIFAISRIIDFTYNDALENYRISVFDDLSFSFEIFEGTASDTSLVFDNTNIVYSSAEADGAAHEQYIISRIDDDAFVMETKVSVDKGETWNPQNKFTYSRKIK